MKKKLVLFFLICGFVMGIGIVPNATATGIPISTYWDVGNDWGGDADSDSKTQIFNQIQYFSETTTFQYDTNNSGDLDVGDVFIDHGNAYSTALLPATPPIDTEGFLSTYEFTFTWSNLTGILTDFNAADPGGSTDTYTLSYTSGTVDFYLDFPPTSGSDWSTHGDPDDPDDLGLDGDANFNDGLHVATVEIEAGTGHSNFDTGTTDFTGGDYNVTGKFTFLTPGFWFDENDEDLLYKYVNLGWLLAYTAGDTDPEHFVQTFGGVDLSDEDVLFRIDANHDTSMELQVIPEPATMLLLGSGLLGLAGLGRKKKFFKKG